MAAIKQTYFDQTLSSALKPLGIPVTSLPQARTSETYRGRPACCGSANCVPLCPIQAKYDATVHVAAAEEKGAQILENAVAVQLDVAPDGKISAVHFNRANKSRGVVFAKHFFLAANAIESAKLLLISRSKKFPDGVANRSGMVGRNLMDHPSLATWALAKVPVYPYRGPQVTSGIEHLRGGESRKTRAGFRVDLANDGWNLPGGSPPQVAAELIGKGLRGQALLAALRDRAVRQFSAIALAEQLSDPNNRVEPAWDKKDALGIARPKLTYRVNDYTKQGLQTAMEMLAKVTGAFSTEAHVSKAFHGAGHLMGTLRMGTDPATSVVDANLRAHDHPNLYCLGAGVFPTGGTANPTLTLSALTLKAVKAFLG